MELTNEQTTASPYLCNHFILKIKIWFIWKKSSLVNLLVWRRCALLFTRGPAVYRKVESKSIQLKLFHAKLANIYSNVQYKLCWRECFQTATRVVAAFTIKQFCYWQIWTDYSFSEDTVHIVIGVYASGLINGSFGPFHGKSLIKK